MGRRFFSAFFTVLFAGVFGVLVFVALNAARDDAPGEERVNWPLPGDEFYCPDGPDRGVCAEPENDDD